MSIKVNIPVPVVRALCASGMSIGQMISMQGGTGGANLSGIDFDSVMRMLDAGACGTLMDIDVSENDGDKVNVRIVVE